VLKFGTDMLKDVMQKYDIMNMVFQVELVGSETKEEVAQYVMIRGGAGAPVRIDFDMLESDMREFANRLRCWLDVSKLPAAQQIDCTDPVVRAAKVAAPTGSINAVCRRRRDFAQPLPWICGIESPAANASQVGEINCRIITSRESGWLTYRDTVSAEFLLNEQRGRGRFQQASRLRPRVNQCWPAAARADHIDLKVFELHR
jgi:hypothetical protein